MVCKKLFLNTKNRSFINVPFHSIVVWLLLLFCVLWKCLAIIFLLFLLFAGWLELYIIHLRHRWWCGVVNLSLFIFSISSFFHFSLRCRREGYDSHVKQQPLQQKSISAFLFLLMRLPARIRNLADNMERGKMFFHDGNCDRENVADMCVLMCAWFVWKGDVHFLLWFWFV